MSQSEAGTSLSQGDGYLERGWWILYTGGLAARAQDMLEPWLSGFMQPSISPQYP